MKRVIVALVFGLIVVTAISVPSAVKTDKVVACVDRPNQPC